MIQLEVLAPRPAEALFEAARFPILVGRSRDASLRIESPGVWEKHLSFKLDQAQGFVAVVQPGARASINGSSFEQARLRNGDLLEFGSAKLRFWLSPVRQNSHSVREALVWFSLGAIILSQAALVYLLLNR